MLPPDDKEAQKFWLWLWGIVASFLLAALGAAYAWIWATIPDKRYVDNKVGESEARIMAAFDDFKENDSKHDRQLFEDLIRPLAGRIDNLKEAADKTERQRATDNRENQKMLKEILNVVKPGGRPPQGG